MAEPLPVYAGLTAGNEQRRIARIVIASRRKQVTVMLARWLLFGSAMFLAAPLPLHAGVYRWVDERGVVNYGDEPPQQARGVRALDSAASVNLIPGIARDELDRLRERDLLMRMQRLEAEVEELRAREAERAAAPPSEPQVVSSRLFWTKFGRPRFVHPDFDWSQRPVPPIARPWPIGIAPLPAALPPLPSSLPRRPAKGLDPFWKN